MKDSHLQWNPLLTFRARKNGKVLVNDPWLCKQSSLSRTSLLSLIKSEIFDKTPSKKICRKLTEMKILGMPAWDKKTFSDIQHWWSRGWHVALDFYFWSRRGKFYDEHDTKREKRSEILNGYLKGEGAPPQRIIPSGQQVVISRPQNLPSNITLGELLIQRKTGRRFARKPVKEPIFSAVLWNGLSDIRHERERRIENPLDYLKSVGAGYDFYLAIYSVDGLKPGLYFYDVIKHDLVIIKEINPRKEMLQILQKMPAPGSAAWTLLLIADVAQYQWRYRHDRALRHLYFESGFVAQKVIIAGESYGLGTLVTPATQDLKLSKFLNIDPTRQFSLYTLTTGIKQPKV